MYIFKYFSLSTLFESQFMVFFLLIIEISSWEAIAAYVNQHISGVSVSGKDVLKQAKLLKEEGKSPFVS